MVVGIYGSGCATRKAIDGHARVDVVAISVHEDAIAGRTLVIPVSVRVLPTRGNPPTLSDSVPVRLGADTTLTGRLYRIRLATGADDPQANWIESHVWWDVRAGGTIPIEEVRTDVRVAGEFWVVSVALPPDANGKTLRVANQKIDVRWRSPREAPRRAVRTSAMPVMSQVVRYLRPIATSPESRWRLWLLNDRKARGVPDLAELLGQSLGHPVLDDLDRQLTDRWRLALRLVDSDDPELSDRLRTALTRLVYFDEMPVPAWDEDTQRISALLEGLLGTSVSSQRVSLAKNWLDRQQRLVTWIDDDSVRAEQQHVTLGIADLLGVNRPITVTDNEGNVLWEHEPRLFGATTVEIASPVGSTMVVEDDSQSVATLRPRPVVELLPPGARLGPFLRTWSMPSWLADEPRAMPAQWAGSGLLYTPKDGGQLRVYLECRVPLDFFVGSQSEDFVRIWCGIKGESVAVLRVSSLGMVHDELTGDEWHEGVTIRRERDRWTAQLELPRHILSDSSTVLLGLERVQANGVRSTWPRPVFPWEIEPGRAVFSLDKWNSK